MEEIRSDLQKVDKLVASVAPSYIEFADTYTSYRIPRKPRTPTMSFLGKVFLAGTLAPAVGATVILSLGNRKYKVTPTGQLRIKNIKPGTYTFTTVFSGYASAMVSIHIVRGTTTRREILPEAEALLQRA